MLNNEWLVCEDMTTVRLSDVGFFHVGTGSNPFTITLHYKPTNTAIVYRSGIATREQCYAILAWIMAGQPEPPEEEESVDEVVDDELAFVPEDEPINEPINETIKPPLPPLHVRKQQPPNPFGA